ncbi:interleukin-17C-like [Mastacembelus armatus]|uniref:Interleukin-17C-like n=1 Tax=Mastacembelus armatus TaxID=205130 RepID=A0A3Q3SL02_9TELE|nr:interleukin-17C-like [Mastacembelus armatus]
MTWANLQMIYLLSLLLLRDPAAAANAHRCVSVDELNSRASRFQRNYWDRLGLSGNPLPASRTCAQTAETMLGDLSERALSPWTYRLDQDDNRFPREISFAKCLCQGCIINQRENLSYNSVPIFAHLMILTKTLCPDDPNKYLVKKEKKIVPVACTCAVPNMTK